MLSWRLTSCKLAAIFVLSSASFAFRPILKHLPQLNHHCHRTAAANGWEARILSTASRKSKIDSGTSHRHYSSLVETTEPSFGGTLLSVQCDESEDIEELGSRLAEVLSGGDVILLNGDLGAGKTTFSRGIIRRLCGDESLRVTSPSYLLDNAYECSPGSFIHHMDLYRLPTGCDLTMLGIPAIFKGILTHNNIFHS